MTEFKKVETEDGSYTLYSPEYHQHYHSTRDGAFSESLYKHVLPAFRHHHEKTHLRILDICFGLGYNTWTTLFHIIKNKLNITVEIFSPELNNDLVRSLDSFEFPHEFDILKPMIKEISENLFYQDAQLSIQLFIGDARDYIKNLSNIDIMYQDAFSSDVNNELWTTEYFHDIYKALNEDAILTSYSIATPFRLGLEENGFFIYEKNVELDKKVTLAFKQEQEHYKRVNMAHKRTLHPDVKSFSDHRKI